MDKRTIFELLDDINNQIQHQTSPITRAKDILSLLKIQLRSIDDNRAADMREAMTDTKALGKYGQLEFDVKLAIYLTEQFLNNYNWDFNATLLGLKPGVDQSKTNAIKDYLRKIIGEERGAEFFE